MALHKGIFEVELNDGSRGIFDGETWTSDSFSEDLLKALNLTSGDRTCLTNFADVNAKIHLKVLGVEDYRVIRDEPDPPNDDPEGVI